MHRLLSSLRFTYDNNNNNNNNNHGQTAMNSSHHSNHNARSNQNNRNNRNNQNNRQERQMFQFNWNRNSTVPRIPVPLLQSVSNDNHDIVTNNRQNTQNRQQRQIIQNTQTSNPSILFQSDIDYDDIIVDNEIESNDTIDEFITDDEFLETIIRDDTNDSIMYVNYLQNNEYDFIDMNSARNRNATDSTYYSLLMYNGERIQFNHNDVLTPADTQDIMENFMSRINEDVFDQVMNESFQQTSQHEKSDEDIQKLKTHLNIIVFSEIQDTVINSQCPISLAPFTGKDRVCYIPKCKHAFHADYIDSFCSHFNKCPLCNSVIE